MVVPDVDDPPPQAASEALTATTRARDGIRRRTGFLQAQMVEDNSERTNTNEPIE
jgi:N-acetylglucosamine kinase-like BadF-type ATPase